LKHWQPDYCLFVSGPLQNHIATSYRVSRHLVHEWEEQSSSSSPGWYPLHSHVVHQTGIIYSVAHNEKWYKICFFIGSRNCVSCMLLKSHQSWISILKWRFSYRALLESRQNYMNDCALKTFETKCLALIQPKCTCVALYYEPPRAWNDSRSKLLDFRFYFLWNHGHLSGHHTTMRRLVSFHCYKANDTGDLFRSESWIWDPNWHLLTPHSVVCMLQRQIQGAIPNCNDVQI